MVNYACAFRQSETEKYFEWIMIPVKKFSQYKATFTYKDKIYTYFK